MNTCPSDIRELLPEYVHGVLDLNETRRVTDHLQICQGCYSEVQILKRLADEVLPDPEPWFFAALPGKVTAEIQARRKRRMRVFIPVWAGCFAVAVFAVVMLLPGAAPDLPTDIGAYASVEAEGAFSMGLEAEILSMPGTLLDDLDLVIGQDLDSVSEEVFFTKNAILEDGVYETMDDETMKLFETLLEEMTPEEIRKKVMS